MPTKRHRDRDGLRDPARLSAEFRGIFPDFECDEDTEEFAPGEHGRLHRVMRQFCEFLGSGRSQLSERQFSQLAAILNEAVRMDDELENAVSTCLLEHLHAIGCYGPLAPHLSQLAKRKTHA